LSARFGADERPPAPWGSFPLAELTILAGLVLLAIGFVGESLTAIAVGAVLGALGGLEVSVREHFAGYRSHTTMLAGVAFVLVTGVLFYAAGTILAVALGGGAVAFLAAFVALRKVFRRASGGVAVRIR
jgi:hypothetical protein